METSLRGRQSRAGGSVDMSDATANQKLPKPGVRDVAKDIEDELAFHLVLSADEAQQKMQIDRSAAEQWAVEKFGNVEIIKRTCLQLAWKERIMEKLFSPVVGMVLMVFCCATIVVIFFQAYARQAMAIEAQHIARKAEQEAESARREAIKAREASEASSRLLMKVFTNVDPEGDKSVSTTQILMEATSKIESEFGDDPEVIEKLLKVLYEAKAKLQETEPESIAENQ